MKKKKVRPVHFVLAVVAVAIFFAGLGLGAYMAFSAPSLINCNFPITRS